MTLPLPTEEAEQMAFVQWLRLKKIAHFRVPNETYTKSWNQKRKNTALGVSSGVPDLFVIVNDQMCAVEMKRKKGGVVSDNQKIWLERLNKAGIKSAVCRGADEAIDFIKSIKPRKEW